MRYEVDWDNFCMFIQYVVFPWGNSESPILNPIPNEKLMFTLNDQLYEYSYEEQRVVANTSLLALYNYATLPITLSRLDTGTVRFDNLFFGFSHDASIGAAPISFLPPEVSIPLQSTWNGVPDDIDAFWVQNHKWAHVFKGHDYYLYNAENNHVDTDSIWPQLAENYFPGIPFPIDDVDYHTYLWMPMFFKNDQVYLYDMNRREVMPGKKPTTHT